MPDYRGDTSTQAFNRGSDARLAGQPIAWNPYDRLSQASQATYWRRGWLHVQRFWGADAKWPVPTLRPVKEVV